MPLEAEADGQRIKHGDGGDFAVIAAKGRPSFFFQQREGKGHISGTHLFAIGKTGIGFQMHGHRGKIIGEINAFGQPAIDAERLVGRADHQALEDQPHRRGQSLCGNAADHKGIQCIKNALRAEHDPPARPRIALRIGQGLTGCQRRGAVQ